MIDAAQRPLVATAPAWWSPFTASGVTLWYTALAVGFTWPTATALSRRLPWDMGDPVLNCWILSWGLDHLTRFLAGDLHAFAGFWNANVFYPQPLALAYSEHLFGQAIQALPIWLLTRNAVLCYNLTLIATFVLSGLGAFLLARDITGDARAAVVAGVVYGFAPYRIAQLSHVQVLSSQWMPLALFALRRHLATGSWRSLAGAAAALLLVNLSCGYFLVYFAPFVAGMLVLELSARSRWGDLRLLARLALVGLVVGSCTWPFLAPYLELRALGFPRRTLDEVARFSADVWGYVTAHPAQWIWGGTLRGWSRAEGELFPGLIAVTLAALAVGTSLWRAWRSEPRSRVPSWRQIASIVAGVVMTVSAGSAALVLVAGPRVFRLFADGPVIRISGVVEQATRAVVAALVLAALSPRARAVALRVARSPVSWWALFAAAAVVLSLGPVASAGGTITMRSTPYGWLYKHVPGYDGLRVPARYGMIVQLGLSILAALGLTTVLGKAKRPALVALVAAALAAVEGTAAPLPLGRSDVPDGLMRPIAALPNEQTLPRVYRMVRTLPRDAVLIEFPFGAEPWEVRYMFASTFHWRRLVNGYSGGAPRSYSANVGAFHNVFRNPGVAWRRLRASGATHVIVHENAYLPGQGEAVTAWLKSSGAESLGRFDDDEMFRMP